MKNLTKSEEIILLAIWRLNDSAYGITIKDSIKKMTGREYLYSTLYSTLEQLVRKGFIAKRYGEPSSVRGGKRKIFFDLSESGLEMLKKEFLQHKSAWDGITNDSFSRGEL